MEALLALRESSLIARNCRQPGPRSPRATREFADLTAACPGGEPGGTLRNLRSKGGEVSMVRSAGELSRVGLFSL